VAAVSLNGIGQLGSKVVSGQGQQRSTEIFMNWRSTEGKSALIKMLMKEHGFSKRKSEKAVNAVFYSMARGLRRGDIVELPIGWMQTASAPAIKQKLQKFKNIQTGKIFWRLVRYPGKIIRFRPNPKLIEKGPFPPPPPNPETIDKVEELNQLLSTLGFPDATSPELRSLLAASVDPNKSCADADLPGYLDRLLARLRQLVREEYKFTDFWTLRDTVRQLYHVR
jgi:nucleoid DNA-binding protein